MRISSPRVGSSTVWIIDWIGAIRYHMWLLTVHAAIHWRHHWVAVRVVRVRRHLAAVHLWVARWVTIWLLGKMERLLAAHLGGADGALSALTVIDLRVLLAIVANGAQLSALVLFELISIFLDMVIVIGDFVDKEGLLPILHQLIVTRG